MARNWIRTCSLVVDGGTSKDLGSLRVVFKIEASSLQSPNMARFRVYNVSRDTAAMLVGQEFSKLQFTAGYVENNGIIYSGDIKQSVIGHETAVDSYVDIFCGDGDQSYNFSHVNKTLNSGWTPQDKFDAALKAMGLTAGVVNVDLSQPKYPRGIPLAGMARDILRGIASNKNALWSMQGGSVDMVDFTKALPTSTVEMNSTTGMIGWPKQTPDGIIVTSLINSALRPNTLIHLNQSSIQQAERDNNSLTEAGSQQNFDLANTGAIAADGMYRILYLNRAGDTRGQEWYDTSTCIAANGASPNQRQLDAGYGNVELGGTG